MKKPTPAAITAIAILVVFLISAVYLLTRKDSDGLLPENTFYGNIAIGGLSLQTAADKIKVATATFEEKGIKITYNNEEFDLPAIAASFDSGVSYNNYNYQTEALEEKLFSYSHISLLSRWLGAVRNKATEIRPEFFINRDKVEQAISEALPGSKKPAVDASFTFKDGKFSVSEDMTGKEADWDNLFSEIDSRLRSFDNSTIVLKTKTAYPQVYARDLQGLEKKAADMSDVLLSLTFKDKEWKVGREEIASWLTAKKQSGGYELDYDESRIESYLAEKIAPEIDIEPQSPRFEIKDEKVTSWQVGKDGYKLETATSSREIAAAYSSAQGPQKIELKIVATPPDEAAAMDIKEIIGTGHSNFSGSSSNRRHNISNGANALHGLIIKPGDEFSLIKALGNIDASGGYVPELVIKNNRTIPEYGGGLCQVGTTMFRTALGSGLPITARQNHSYRVSYYEPAGTDATIYDPWPDFRFINDTGSNILIQSRIEGNDLYFDFWGTKDGRTATTTYPVIYNIVKPAPTKIVETEELKPGERKCTEKAHNGADAWFDYTVVYPEGSTTTPEVKRRFQSHYVPWQEVCLVGKATSTPVTSTSTPIATGTPPIATSTR
ncbi:MAG: VanW family protein [Bacillota bacterium]